MFKIVFKITVFFGLLSQVFFAFASSAVSREIEPWTNLGLYGGQIYDIAIDPSNPDKMFAGTYMGDGLYVTTDGGNSWQPAEDTFKERSVRAVKIAPSDNDIVWATYTYSVKKSVDGGNTWLYISYADMQCTCQNCGGWGDGLRDCISLAVDPSDARTVYVGTTGPNKAYLGSPGAIYKTEDGGSTWTKTNQGNDFDYTVVDIDIDPQNSNIIWAVTNRLGDGGSCAGTLYRSGDRGESWKKIMTLDPDPEFMTVAVKPDNSNTVFTGSYSDKTSGISEHYLDGDEWLCRQSIPIDDGYAVVLDIAFCPQDPEVLYAVWENIRPVDPSSGLSRKVSRSVNGGIDWETYAVDYAFSCLAVHPTNSEVIFGGEEYCGIYKSQDHGQSWHPVNKGIKAAIVYDLAIDPNDSAHILAGTLSGVYEKKPGKTSCSRLLQHGITSLKFHPTKSLTFYAGVLWGYLAKTTDGGLSWTYSNYLDWCRVNDIAIDPHDTDTVYIAASRGSDYIGRIYKSEDGGALFREVWIAENQYGASYDFNVVTFDPSDPQHLFAGGGDFYVPEVPGDLWESRDGGENWSRTGLNDKIVNALIIDPQNPSTMYAGCGHGSSAEAPLYKSTDGGKNWRASFVGIPKTMPQVIGLWGSCATNVFAVGDNGTILHYDGKWTAMSSGTQQWLNAVWGSSATNVFAVGDNGTVLCYDGKNWIDMDSGTKEHLWGVWGSSAINVFAVGSNGTILHYDGKWTAMSSGTQQWLNAVWGSSATNVFAVGDNGTILHYDGGAWHEMISGTKEHLWGVWGSSPKDIFVAGYNGVILHFDGITWARMNSNTTRALVAVWGNSQTDVFAVGEGGVILHFNGSTWSNTGPRTKNVTYHCVWGTSGRDLFIGGSDGSIIHYNGDVFSSMRSGSHVSAVTDLEFHHRNTQEPQDINVIYASTYGAGIYISPDQADNWLNLGTPDYYVHAISTSSLYAATDGELLQCTGTGLIAGQVRNALSQSPINNATVFNDFGVKTISVNGEYMMVSPSGTCVVTAIADGYASKTAGDITVYGGDVTWADIAMGKNVSEPSTPEQGSSHSVRDYQCFIATAAYGSPMAEQVQMLRSFRDKYLLPCPLGQKLVSLYYTAGKPAAQFIESHPSLKRPIRIILYPMVGLAWMLLSANIFITRGVIIICMIISCLGAVQLFLREACDK